MLLFALLVMLACVLNFDRSTVKPALQNTPNDCHQGLSDSFRVHQIRFRQGLRPDWRAYSAPLDPLAGLRGNPTSKGRAKEGRERWRKFLDPPLAVGNAIGQLRWWPVASVCGPSFFTAREPSWTQPNTSCWASYIGSENYATHSCSSGACSRRSISAARARAQQQTSGTSLLLSTDETDRRTDGRTPDRYIDPALHSMRAALTGRPSCSVATVLCTDWLKQN